MLWSLLMDLRFALMPISDALLAIAALYSAVVLRYGSFGLHEELQAGQGPKVCAIFVVVALFSSYLMEVYRLARGSRKLEIFITCLQTGGAAFFLLSVVYYLEPGAMLGRGVLFIALAMFVLYQFLWHALAASGARSSLFSQRVLILGTGELARELGALLTSPSVPFTLVGYLGCGYDAMVNGELLIEKEGDLLGTAREAKAGIIVVGITERRGVLPLQEMMRCKLDGIEVVDAPTFYEVVQGKLMLEQMTPSSIIFSIGFRRTLLINVWKRCIDILFSVAGLLISAPFFPLIVLAIRIESPGHPLFKQVRVGKGEKHFVLYKFRSMRQDAESGGAVWAAKNDARVTAVGRFIRNSRIDELPQLYNVLRGDMSFIGPRPERPEFVEKLKHEIDYYSKRHTIKPGITGWAQVRFPYGATVEDAIEKLRYDLYYIKNLSAFLEIQIIFETVKVVLFGRGGR